MNLPARLQAGGAPAAGLLPCLLFLCRDYTVDSPLPSVSWIKGIEVVSSKSGCGCTHELDAVRPPPSSPSQYENTRSSASPRVAPYSIHACREALDRRNRRRLLLPRPPLPHSSSTPSRLLRPPRSVQHIHGTPLSSLLAGSRAIRLPCRSVELLLLLLPCIRDSEE